LLDAGVELGSDAVAFDFRAGQDLPSRMRAAGFNPEAVHWVINSHLHADHCGGNAGFPNATIVIQRREWDAARRNEDGRSYDPADFDHGQPRLEIDGEHDLFRDGSLVLFPTYGHTPGHQSARVRLPGGEVVLTADCCYWQEGLEQMVVPGINHDPEASLSVLRQLRDMRVKGVRLLFGHDPVQWLSITQGEPIRPGAKGPKR
jgi:N-acyl homoserine lactone hydrolase